MMACTCRSRSMGIAVSRSTPNGLSVSARVAVISATMSS